MSRISVNWLRRVVVALVLALALAGAFAATPGREVAVNWNSQPPPPPHA